MKPKQSGGFLFENKKNGMFKAGGAMVLKRTAKKQGNRAAVKKSRAKKKR